MENTDFEMLSDADILEKLLSGEIKQESNSEEDKKWYAALCIRAAKYVKAKTSGPGSVYEFVANAALKALVKLGSVDDDAMIETMTAVGLICVSTMIVGGAVKAVEPRAENLDDIFEESLNKIKSKKC